MEKNLSINIAIDGVPLKDIEHIQEEMDAIFAEYADKRITIILQDTPLVKFS